MSADAHDVAAEEALLGSVLREPTTAGPVLLAVPPDAWYLPKHAAIAAVLADRFSNGDPIDPLLVLRDLTSRQTHGLGPGPGADLARMFEHAWTPASADRYAHRIMRCASRRGLAAAGTRLQQTLDHSWASGWDEPITEFTEELRAACTRAELADAGIDMDEPSESIGDLLAEPDVAEDWLVPGLLERGERIILTGGEGYGKSTMGTQFAMTLAGGMHPFTGMTLGSGGHSLRVLVVDCENGRNQTKRRFRRVATPVDAALANSRGGGDWRENLRVEILPAGVDLLGADGGWLERKVAANTPDLLVVGPLYKITTGRDLNDALVAHQLLAVIDRIRVRYRCAILTEAHAGHEKDNSGRRKLRPAGSSVLMRWPEFGYGLDRAKGEDDEHPRVVDVVAWRGSREDRQWPRQLRHGGAFELPWLPEDERYYQDAA